MAMAVGGNEGNSYSDINMTPLIDVMLVLLIIFIITIPSQTHAVKIDNPLPPPPNHAAAAAAGGDRSVDRLRRHAAVEQDAGGSRDDAGLHLRRRPPRIRSRRCTSPSTSSRSTKSSRRRWPTCSIGA